MKESIEKAQEELKRADHLVYVSLKYTRTVDVIRSVIQRLINAFDCGTDALLEYAYKKKKITHKPTLVTQKCATVRKLFKDEPEIVKLIDLYLLMRRIEKADFSREREFRRHVSMNVTVEGEMMNINIDLIYRYFDRTKEFIEIVKEKINENNQKG